MERPNDKMYEIKDGVAIPIRVNDMEWILRYGSEEAIIKNRLYIAHIVSLYRQQQNK